MLCVVSHQLHALTQSCHCMHNVLSSLYYRVLASGRTKMRTCVRRWCKGGMQICFNARKCPLLRRELPLFQRLLWATGYWVGFYGPAAGR